MFNLLTEKMFSVRLPSGSDALLSLPGVLASVGQQTDLTFLALRPHQWQAWHCFLSQLGAMALTSSTMKELPQTEDDWLAALRKLSADWPDDEPWRLVNDDWAAPAFLQFPSPGDSVKDFKASVSRSDQLDLLVTSKNHDLKIGAAQQPQIDDWLYALINLQTTEGFLGRGNYGIARMNGGFSSRCFVGLAPEGGMCAHIHRDIRMLINSYSKVLKRYQYLYAGDQSQCLLWLDAWDGNKSRAMTNLHPYFIECCRRVRFQPVGDGFSVLLANSKAALLEAKALQGNTGDPWAPLQKDEPKTLSLTAGGFDYRRVAELLDSEKWHQTLASTVADSEGGQPMVLVLSALVRGQGKTEGLHQRKIPLSKKTVQIMGSPRQMDLLGEYSKRYVKYCSIVSKHLVVAVQLLSAGAPDLVTGRMDLKSLGDADKNRSEPYRAKFQEYVDLHFFDALWAAWEAPESEKNKKYAEWVRQLITEANQLLYHAESSLPNNITRYRAARVGSKNYFNGLMRKEFPWIETKEELSTT